MAASPRPLLLQRYRDLHVSTPSLLPVPLPLRRLRRPIRPRSLSIAACLASGFDGGGVADDIYLHYPGCRKGEFSALASVLRRIEPLDTSVIGKGVSAAARDSMKRTISTMLGLLPSDQFDVSVRVSNRPLRHLLVSSIVTGYTLWNAEYRVSLMRKFENSPGSEQAVKVASGDSEVVGEEGSWTEEWEGVGCCVEVMDGESLGELSEAASSYIQELEEELAAAEKTYGRSPDDNFVLECTEDNLLELDDQKHEYVHLEHNKEEDNDLLKYLRSLEPAMVSELSQPSSPEVEEIIQQLVQGIHIRYFNDASPNFLQDMDKGESFGCEKDVNIHDGTIVTTRDYLAKLLFWCMLLGHHLRGLEHRLHLSCVGLL